MAKGIGSKETERLLAEYQRREAVIPAERYAPWNPAEMLMRSERLRLAAGMLRQVEAFPGETTACLEVGYGRLGWLGDLVAWGVRENSLHGIELDAMRAAQARERLPAADLRVGDGADLPWPEASFGLVVTSTVLTSVLEPAARRALASEIIRVLRPGGALVCYDFRVNNPRNSRVRAIGRLEVRELFGGLEGNIRSLTLAPPLARRVTPWSYPTAVLLGCLPFLRTHLLAVLIKQPSPS